MTKFSIPNPDKPMKERLKVPAPKVFRNKKKYSRKKKHKAHND